MTPRLIIIGGLAVVLTVTAVVAFLPLVVFQPEDTLEATPYTALQQEGRDLFVSNGCMYCHSQFTRPNDVSPSRPSQAGDFNYDKPHQLGTLRTGPDLANIGLKRGDKWEYDHLREPRSLTPNSIMPSFSFLSDHQLQAIVAYLNRLGNNQTASTDLMIPAQYEKKKQPHEVNVENWNRGRKIYATHCLTCHGCAGKGDGPYAMINNARPADLRQPRFQTLPSSFDFWRVSEGVPGTVMPKWRQSLSENDRWLAVLFIQHAFMDMVPHLTDEGDLPSEYDLPDPIKETTETIRQGKAIFVANCAFCHGYSGTGNGPDAPGLMPAPPDFADGVTYNDWKPGDWYWRVSESLPMRAMPQWKTWFDSHQLWLVATYVRDMLAFTNPDREPDDSDTPARYESLKAPSGSNVMRGRAIYLRRCWMCHGDAGQGEGQSGQNLGPLPANFTDPDVAKMTDGRWFWRVSEGVDNSAMPLWHLLLSQQDRWEAIAYIKATFVFPSEPTDVDDNPPPEYQAIDPAPYASTPDSIARGKVMYATYCQECHGGGAKGDGPYGKPLKPTPANLTEEPGGTSDATWWYWRIDQGVVGDEGTHPTAMPAWRFIFTEAEKWDVVYGARAIAGLKDVVGGGQ